MRHPITAIVVTRGDLDLDNVLEPLLETFDEVLVWNNGNGLSARRGSLVLDGHDWKVYGRYAPILNARHEVIYVQDDDVIVPRDSLEALVEAARPGSIVCNMPERFRVHYTDSALVGFGAIFDRNAPFSAFTRFGIPVELLEDERFLRCCDVVFTTLTPFLMVDVPYVELPAATDPTRAMYLQPGHVGERTAVLEAAKAIRDGKPVTLPR